MTTAFEIIFSLYLTVTWKIDFKTIFFYSEQLFVTAFSLKAERKAPWLCFYDTRVMRNKNVSQLTAKQSM